MIVYIRTVDVKVLNPKGPNIFVQNGDAAYSSKKREVVDSIYEAGPGNISRPQHYRTDGCATHPPCCLLMLLGGSFLALCSLRVGCTDGCVHQRTKNRPDVTWYNTRIFLGLHQNLAYVN